MKYLSLSLILVLALAMTTLSGCGYKTGTVQPDSAAYLWFSGNAKDVTAVIDGQAPFELKGEYSSDPMNKKKSTPGEVHYQVKPGKHSIKLFRNGELIVDRVILIGNTMTKEIQIP